MLHCKHFYLTLSWQKKNIFSRRHFLRRKIVISLFFKHIRRSENGNFISIFTFIYFFLLLNTFGRKLKLRNERKSICNDQSEGKSHTIQTHYLIVRDSYLFEFRLTERKFFIQFFLLNIFSIGKLFWAQIKWQHR